MTESKPTLVLGVGNAGRGDDGAGLAVARRLQREPLPGVEVWAGSGDLTSLLDALAGRERVILVDAATAEERTPAGPPGPGSIRRFDLARQQLPVSLAARSSHALGLATALELLRALGRLPPEVAVYAIEGRNWGHQDGLSPEVERAVGIVEARIRAELGPY